MIGPGNPCAHRAPRNPEAAARRNQNRRAVWTRSGTRSGCQSGYGQLQLTPRCRTIAGADLRSCHRPDRPGAPTWSRRQASRIGRLSDRVFGAAEPAGVRTWRGL